MSNYLSDNNFRKSPRVSHEILYSDIPLGLNIHPNTNDLTVLKDLDSIKQSVKNLVLTNFTERLFEPNIGGNISALLFEPADPFTIIAIKENILNVLRDYEPRITDIIVEAFDQSDRNSYFVNISFTVISSGQVEETNLYLERTR